MASGRAEGGDPRLRCPGQAITSLLADFEIDFLSLSFVREADDLHAARDFLDSIGAQTTKVRAVPEQAMEAHVGRRAHRQGARAVCGRWLSLTRQREHAAFHHTHEGTLWPQTLAS